MVWDMNSGRKLFPSLLLSFLRFKPDVPPLGITAACLSGPSLDVTGRVAGYNVTLYPDMCSVDLRRFVRPEARSIFLWFPSISEAK